MKQNLCYKKEGKTVRIWNETIMKSRNHGSIPNTHTNFPFSKMYIWDEKLPLNWFNRAQPTSNSIGNSSSFSRDKIAGALNSPLMFIYCKDWVQLYLQYPIPVFIMYTGAMLHLQLRPTANLCPCSQESKHEKP